LRAPSFALFATERRGSASSVDKPWGEASFVASAATLVAGDQYSLLKTILIPGDYNWDYLTADSKGRRLYVSHDKEVVVIDLDSAAIAGKIPDSNVRGIAVVKELGRGFISATDPGSITIFDLKTLAVVGTVTVGKTPMRFSTTVDETRVDD